MSRLPDAYVPARCLAVGWAGLAQHGPAGCGVEDGRVGTAIDHSSRAAAIQPVWMMISIEVRKEVNFGTQ